MKRRILILLSILLAVATTVTAQTDSISQTLPELSNDAMRLLAFANDDTEAPDLTTYVIDKADVLTKEQENELTGELQKCYRESDVQVKIITTNDYEGIETTDYGERYLDFNDRAAVLLVNPTETDSALRATIVPGRDFKYFELNETTCQTIVNQNVIPAIDSAGYYIGVVRGMVMIKMAINGEYHVKYQEDETSIIYDLSGVLFFGFIFLLLIYIVVKALRHGAGSDGGHSGSSYSTRDSYSSSYSSSYGSSSSFGGGSFGGGGGGGSW